MEKHMENEMGTRGRWGFKELNSIYYIGDTLSLLSTHIYPLWQLSLTSFTATQPYAAAQRRCNNVRGTFCQIATIEPPSPTYAGPRNLSLYKP